MMGRFFRSLYVGRMTEYFSDEATKDIVISQCLLEVKE